MYGLEAINAHNGWAMAAVGACIVLTGLSVLSFLISQLHKFVGIMEKKDKNETVKPEIDAQKETQPVVPERFPDNAEEAAELFQSFVADLGASFKLSDLYKASEKVGLPHPHISIRGFREKGLLVPDSNGLFSWNLS